MIQKMKTNTNQYYDRGNVSIKKKYIYFQDGTMEVIR